MTPDAMVEKIWRAKATDIYLLPEQFCLVTMHQDIHQWVRVDQATGEVFFSMLGKRVYQLTPEMAEKRTEL